MYQYSRLSRVLLQSDLGFFKKATLCFGGTSSRNSYFLEAQALNEIETVCSPKVCFLKAYSMTYLGPYCHRIQTLRFCQSLSVYPIIFWARTPLWTRIALEPWRALWIRVVPKLASTCIPTPKLPLFHGLSHPQQLELFSAGLACVGLRFGAEPVPGTWRLFLPVGLWPRALSPERWPSTCSRGCFAFSSAFLGLIGRVSKRDSGSLLTGEKPSSSRRSSTCWIRRSIPNSSPTSSAQTNEIAFTYLSARPVRPIRCT